MRSIYVMATGQNVGKTTVSLGLLSALAEKGLSVGFFKPVGQQYVETRSGRVDKDALLMSSAFALTGDIAEMSPVTVPRGFVERYLFERAPEKLRRQILDCHARLQSRFDLLVVEGTGHAGVGACFDLSNAQVAALLGSRVLMVVEGGIGSTLDQVALNRSLFDAAGVELIGVAANKVFPEKLERVESALQQGLANMGLKLCGVIPYEPQLTHPRVRQVAQTLDAQVLCGHEALDERVESFLVAAMEPQNVLPRLKNRSMVITPGDRIDNILVSMNSGLFRVEGAGSVAGLILTGGLMPHFSIIALMRNSGLPVLLCREETFEVSARVEHMAFKILPEDTDKIASARRLIGERLEVDAILDAARTT